MRPIFDHCTGIRALSICVALLCGLATLGCAGKKTAAERPKDIQARTSDLERIQHEQAQRLGALEGRVDALQQRSYEVYTQGGQKTRYIVRSVAPVQEPVVPTPQPVAVIPRPPAAAPQSPQPAQAPPPPLTLPSETAPPAVSQAPVATAAKPQPVQPLQAATPILSLPPERAPEGAPEGTPSGHINLKAPIVPDAPKAPAAPVVPIVPDAKLPPSVQGEDAAYANALNHVRAGQYVQGREKFQEFLNAYPSGRYAANAYYWIGESYYAQHQYAESLAQFRLAAERFPKHHKTADALLKAGMAYQKLGDTENAAQQFRTLLTDFPRSEAAQNVRSKGWGR